ncbi:hypothetical protein PVAP13_6KG284400 [Panicum virgatum]|uniref:Uncharacterized protein n=1 Tax=Panicum virgatum TaxID=38727 RepID=A0A8T0RFL4_PANVG|nr:hypothetical protein PVAP13_6KG284400 [Panicum virgatum]
MAPSIPPYSSVYSLEPSSLPHGQVKSPTPRLSGFSPINKHRLSLHPHTTHYKLNTTLHLLQPERERERESMGTQGKITKISRGMVSLRRRRPFQLMVLRRLRELKKIVPVGTRRKADVDAVLRQTAEYICVLELKVATLRRLSNIYGV